MLDRNMLRVIRVETYPKLCMFIGVFNDVRDIYMINSILRKPKYHQILQRRASTSEKEAMWRWFIDTFLTCETELKEDAKTEII